MANQENRNSIWAAGIDSEVTFWRHWFADDAYKSEREARREVLVHGSCSAEIAKELGANPGDVLRILDVGSGPVSTQRMRAPNNPVELICVDALADIYNVLLDEFGYTDCPKINKVKGEELTLHYAKESFHLVNIANALDHCEDPAKTLVEMYMVCRPRGQVQVLSIENEGERERYIGLHQWNLNADDQGLWLWNPSFRLNLLESLSVPFSYTWEYVDHGQKGFKIFSVKIVRGGRP